MTDLDKGIVWRDRFGQRWEWSEINGWCVDGKATLGGHDPRPIHEPFAPLSDDPRIPGIEASIAFLSRYCNGRHKSGYSEYGDIGKELFHVMKELEYWVQRIKEGDENG